MLNPENFELSIINIQLPDVARLLTNRLKKLYPSISYQILLATIMVKLAQVVCSKRILINESGRINIPDIFSLIFLQSGGGKDRLVDDLDKYVFSEFHSWFKKMANQFYHNRLNNQAIKKMLNENIILVDEIQNGTTEGVALLDSFPKDLNWGSIFIKIPEFGLYNLNATKQQQFVCNLNEMYSCKIPTKITKTYGFAQPVTNIPVNALFYTDYTLFGSGSLEKFLHNILNVGFGRRFFVCFQQPSKLTMTNLTDREERKIYDELKNIGKTINEKFQSVKIILATSYYRKLKNY